ncbi:MAG: bifunctional diguanylate cyclase/phosphodiesterase [Treponema sp.]|nr:bifunctional diguanylate cyclase/phosphodiesterase [Treponema sp.]
MINRKNGSKIKMSRTQKGLITIVGMISLVVANFVLISIRQRIINEKEDAAKLFAESIKTNITVELNKSIDSTGVLKNLYIKYDDVFYRDFEVLGEILIRDIKTMGSLYLAPNGIVSRAYPKSVYESTIGFDMLNDPEQQKDALRAIEEQSIIVAGPLNLIEGGTGLIIRNPAFTDRKFRGFSIAVVNWEVFKRNVTTSLYPSLNNYHFAVWKDFDEYNISDENGYIYSNVNKSISENVVVKIELPGDDWYLAVEPVDGWFNLRDSLLEFLIVILLFFVVNGLVIFSQIENAIVYHMIKHDPLTGILSRDAFYTTVEKLFKDHAYSSYDVLVADIEHFKFLNSVYGKEKCDEFLKYFAKEFEERGPKGISARYGGDQFVTVFPSENNQGKEYLKNQTAIAINNAPIKNVVVKYGFYGDVDKSLPVNLICDRALQAAKSVLHNYDKVVESYNGNFAKKLIKEQMFESAFENAIKTNQFKVWFQPKFDSFTEKMVGAEALVRWVKDDGVIAPSEFIYVFENDGLIVRLDEFVFTKVCDTVKFIMDEGLKIVPISVNLSRNSLYHKGMIERYKAIIQERGIPIEYIPLEITETSSTKNKQIKELSQNLKEVGFKIHMDDFGSGLSSMEILNILPFDELKLDKSLIDYIGEPGGNELLRHILELAHLKELMVVAEGVETKEQLDYLRNYNCDMIQGYYFKAPMSQEVFLEYYRRQIAEGNI